MLLPPSPEYVTDVAATRSSEGLQILAVTNYGRVFHAIRYLDGTWSRLGDVKGQTGDPGPVARAAIARSFWGEVHVLVSTTGGGLFHAIRDYYGAWTPMGNVKQVTGDPGWVTDVAAAGVNFDLQITVATNNGGLFHAIRGGWGSNPWTAMGNVKQVTGDPGPVTRVSITG